MARRFVKCLGEVRELAKSIEVVHHVAPEQLGHGRICSVCPLGRYGERATGRAPQDQDVLTPDAPSLQHLQTLPAEGMKRVCDRGGRGTRAITECSYPSPSGGRDDRESYR